MTHYQLIDDQQCYEAAAAYIALVNELLAKANRHSAGCIVTRVHALLYLGELNDIPRPNLWSANDAYERAVETIKAMITPGQEKEMGSLVRL